MFTRFTGPGTWLPLRKRLVIARGLWVALVSLALGPFVVAFPARFEELVSLSLQAERTFQQLSLAEQRTLLGLGLWLDGYASYILTLEIAVIVMFSFTAAVIIWRQSDDWMALFVSLAHVMYAVYISPPLDTLIRVQPAWGLFANVMQALGLICALLFLCLLLDGRLVPRWTRPLTLVWIIMTAE